MTNYWQRALPLALILGAAVGGHVQAKVGLECVPPTGAVHTAPPSPSLCFFGDEADTEESNPASPEIVAIPSPTPGSGRPNQAPPNAQIRLVSPQENAIVPIGQNKVEIATQNFALDASHRWKVFLDGALIGTIENGSTTYTLPIGVSGPHQIKVTLSDPQQEEVASATVQVTAAPETPSSSPFNLPWVAAVMGVFLIGVATLIAVSLRMTRPRVTS